MRKKRPHKTSPKTPSRVKKRRGKAKSRAHAHHHPELIGLALAAFGVFLGAVLWLGFNGGPVADLVQGAVGAAAYLAPVVLIPIGALMVGKSELVDVRPFRLGLGIALAGVLLTLGTATAVLVGDGLASLVALGLGTTGATILGVLLAIAGTLFLTGASRRDPPPLGARGAQRAHSVRAQTRERGSEPRAEVWPRREPPVDVKHDYPALVSDSISGPAPPLFDAEPDEPVTAETHESQETLFDLPPSRPNTSSRTGRSSSAPSPASGRAARPPSASPRRSSPASRTSGSRRPSSA